MFKHLSILLLCTCFLVKGKAAVTKDDPDMPGLEISFSVSENDDPMGRYQIIIVQNDQPNDTVYARWRFPVYMLLELNRNYCLRICKPGYKERIVMVDTHVAKGLEKAQYAYDFEINMIPEDQPGNTMFDMPVALLKFNPHTRDFDYSRKYLASVRVPNPGTASTAKL